MTGWQIIWMALFIVFVSGAFYMQERRIVVLENKMRMAISDRRRAMIPDDVRNVISRMAKKWRGDEITKSRNAAAYLEGYKVLDWLDSQPQAMIPDDVREVLGEMSDSQHGGLRMGEAPDELWVYEYPEWWGELCDENGNCEPLRGGIDRRWEDEPPKASKIIGHRYIRADSQPQLPEAE